MHLFYILTAVRCNTWRISFLFHQIIHKQNLFIVVMRNAFIVVKFRVPSLKMEKNCQQSNQKYHAK